jgi:hypothetical protein
LHQIKSAFGYIIGIALLASFDSILAVQHDGMQFPVNGRSKDQPRWLACLMLAGRHQCRARETTHDKISSHIRIISL